MNIYNYDKLVKDRIIALKKDNNTSLFIKEEMSDSRRLVDSIINKRETIDYKLLRLDAQLKIGSRDNKE